MVTNEEKHTWPTLFDVYFCDNINESELLTAVPHEPPHYVCSVRQILQTLKHAIHYNHFQSNSVCTIDTSIAMCLLYLWHYQSHTNLLFHFISAKLTYCIESNQLKWNAVIFNEKRIDDLTCFFRKVTFFGCDESCWKHFVAKIHPSVYSLFVWCNVSPAY